MDERADRLAAAVAEAGLDALLVSDLVDVRYLTGFTGSSGLALVGATGERLFVTDFRYRTQSEEQLSGAWSQEIAPELPERLIEVLGDGVTRLGFDDTTVTVKGHAHLADLVGAGVELVPAGGMVTALRLIKDAGELERIRAAQALADAALTDVLARGLVGRTERAVALDLEVTMRELGAEGVAFAPIVAAGAHGALPHATPRDVVIAERTLCVVDWGAQLDGYASDCTRTYATSDALAEEDRAVYDLVLEAQESALAAVRPGLRGQEVDAVAREIIDAAGHAEHFEHGLGHGVGLEVHEGPRLSRKGENELAAGHVVTVEPGVYVPGRVGVRIEDLVVVTAEGCEMLTSLPKALIVAPSSV